MLNEVEVNLFDKNFAHSINEDGFDTCSAGRKPKIMKWVRNNLEYNGVTVFTDDMLFDPVVDRVKCDLKIGWCQESPAIRPYVYEHITKVEEKFDYILTFHPELLKRNPAKYKLQLIASSRVQDNDFEVHKKTKPVSIIASDKVYSVGHQLRHEVVKRLEGVDCWGSGYKKFDNKIDPLKDYMFSLAIMNYKIDNYFTEIITDCCALGTVPIFWGCPNIGRYFNSGGIIMFDNINDLFDLKLSKKLYESKIKAIQENVELAKSFSSTDDMVAQNIIKLTRT